MNPTSDTSSNSSRWPLLRAWLVVASLDIAAAIIQTLVGGASLERLGQYIASGVFGQRAFGGGTTFALVGYIFHYGIALGWTILFFLIHPRLKAFARSWIIIGIGYGILVWFMMNRVILPLSNAPQRPFDISRAALACAILIVAIGLPLAWMASGRKKAE